MKSENRTFIRFIAALFGVLLCLHPAAAFAAECIGTTDQYLNGSGALTEESTLGDALADAVRLSSGADIAIVCGGDVADCELAAGEQTEETIRNAVNEDRSVGLASVTPKQLTALLEACLSGIVLDDETKKILQEDSAFEAFPQFSGFTLKYDASAMPGERVMYLTLDNGTELSTEDDSTVLTLAADEILLQGGYGGSALDDTLLNLTLTQALEEYISSGMTVTYSREDRLTAAGTTDETIIEKIPYGVLIAVVVLLAAGNGVKRVRSAKNDQDHENDPDWGMY